jgi:N-acylglucosamine 2-epimerase
LRDTYRDGLLEDVLPFWITHGIDTKNGGYVTALDRDGSLLDRDKSVWVQGRFAWLLAELNHVAGPNPEWLKLAESGLDFIDQHGADLPRCGYGGRLGCYHRCLHRRD